MLRVQISGDRVVLVNLVDYQYVTESVECMDREEADKVAALYDAIKDAAEYISLEEALYKVRMDY